MDFLPHHHMIFQPSRHKTYIKKMKYSRFSFKTQQKLIGNRESAVCCACAVNYIKNTPICFFPSKQKGKEKKIKIQSKARQAPSFSGKVNLFGEGVSFLGKEIFSKNPDWEKFVQCKKENPRRFTRTPEKKTPKKEMTVVHHQNHQP